MVFFFFSSRRRHTRCGRDWSSDVCSSDLKWPDTNGELNKLSPQDRPIHDWYRFVLSFPPHLVRDYLDRFAIRNTHRVLDPFCGTGTTIVECRKRGVPSVGVEANPMAHFASRVKADWS